MSEENTNPVANVEDDGTIKVNLDALQKQSADEVPVRNEPEVSEEVQPENVEQPVEEPAREEEKPVEAAEPKVQNAENVEENESVLTEIINEEVEETVEAVQEEVAEAIEEAQETGEPLPENIQKVVDFMNDTGGTLEDYVKLNTDYAALSETQLLREYYETTRPHLEKDEIDFLMEDNFSYDEEIDEERDVRKKKIANKEELAKAKNHLDGLKSKYYDEIKMGSRLNPDQQKAVEFFNRYNKENEKASKVAQVFNNKTKQLFSDNFEGFDYQVGDKKYRFKVKNVDSVKENQSDINNFVKKFLNEKGEMSDAKGYHKSLFTAMNADQVAKHFYEQGKADAMKDSIGRSKNVNMNPRGVHQEVTTSNGWKIRAVDGNTSSSKLRVKFKN